MTQVLYAHRSTYGTAILWISFRGIPDRWDLKFSSSHKTHAAKTEDMSKLKDSYFLLYTRTWSCWRPWSPSRTCPCTWARPACRRRPCPPPGPPRGRGRTGGCGRRGPRELEQEKKVGSQMGRRAIRYVETKLSHRQCDQIGFFSTHKHCFPEEKRHTPIWPHWLSYSRFSFRVY